MSWQCSSKKSVPLIDTRPNHIRQTHPHPVKLPIVERYHARDTTATLVEETINFCFELCLKEAELQLGRERMCIMFLTYSILFLFLLVFALVCMISYLIITARYDTEPKPKDWRRCIYWCCMFVFSAVSAILLTSVYTINWSVFVQMLITHWLDFLILGLFIFVIVAAIHLLSPTRLHLKLAKTATQLLHSEDSALLTEYEKKEEELRALALQRKEKRRDENAFDLAMRTICVILMITSVLAVAGAFLLDRYPLTESQGIISILQQVSVFLMFLALPISFYQTLTCFRLLREYRMIPKSKEEDHILELLKKDNTAL